MRPSRNVFGQIADVPFRAALELGVTEEAPQIASGEANEHGGRADEGAFSLNRGKDAVDA
jgi:hypothetical protein